MIGKKLKNYKLLQIIGEGGMSTVYLSRHVDSGSLAAIKVLKRAYTQDQDHLKRFFTREIETTRNLDHPNIVKLLDYGRKDSTYFLIYEYVQGVNLDKYIAKHKKLPVKTIESITLQLLSALSHAHSENIVHRDIKPQNILVTQDGKVKVLDFGIAKALSSTTITQTGMFMGSPGYISPEQAEGQKVDGRSDLYSLGVLLFEMLTKRLPFRADTPAGLLYKHVHEAPPDISKTAKNIPYYLSHIVSKSLEKHPSDRFSSAEEIYNIITSKSYASETMVKTLGLKQSPILRLKEEKRETEDKLPKQRLSLSKKLAIILPISAVVIAVLITTIFFLTRNHIPEITNMYLSPEEPVTTDNITLGYEFSDRNGDSNNNQIKWYINGTHKEKYDNQNTIFSKDISKGDKIYAVITPYNDKDYGEAIQSETITVINSPPIISNITITSEKPTDRDDIRLDYDYYDSDGDPDNSKVEWYVNGNHIKDNDDLFLMYHESFNPYDEIKISIIPYDGYSYGNDSGSKDIVISRSIPNPEVVSGIYDDIHAIDVYIKDNYAYVADFYGGLKIIDISDKQNLKVVGSVPTPANANGVYVQGDYAYIIDYFLGLHIIDITDKKNPYIVKSIVTYDGEGNYANDIYVEGDIAYLCSGTVDLQIIDISDKNNPVLMGKVVTEGYGRGIAINGEYAYNIIITILVLR